MENLYEAFRILSLSHKVFRTCPHTVRQALHHLFYFCSLFFERKQKVFSSPQSRNAPILPVSATFNTASSSNVIFGSCVVAIRRSDESLYKNTSTGSPTSTSFGTCFSEAGLCHLYYQDIPRTLLL